MAEKKMLSTDTMKRDYLAAGSAEEAKVIASFKKALTEDRSDLLKTISEQKKWFQKKDLSETGEELDATNKMFMQRMMMVASMPLSRGLSADGLVQTIGMYAGMLASSKAMREAVKGKVSDVCKKGCDIVIKLTEKNAKMDPEAKQERLDRWNSYRERIVRFENGGRMPYTADSAAFAQMCIDKSTYLELRKPGADYEELLEFHDQASEHLAVMCELDGVSREEMCAAHRTMVGMMADHDPSISELYWDLAKDKVVRSEPHTVTQFSEDEFGNTHISRMDVWTGEYELKSGEPFDGRFSIRLPMSEGEYATEMTALVRDQFAACKTGADVQKVHSEISTFIKTISDPKLYESDTERQNIASRIGEDCYEEDWSSHNIQGFRDMVRIANRFASDHPFDDPSEVQKQMCETFTNVADLEFESFCCDHSDAAIEWESIYDERHGKTTAATRPSPQTFHDDIIEANAIVLSEDEVQMTI